MQRTVYMCSTYMALWLVVFTCSACSELNSQSRHVEIMSLHKFIELLYTLVIRFET
jgi:Ni,Fe-hydrogenase I small subunit